MTTARKRILLADDHELFREGLAGLVNGQPDLEVVAEAGDGLEALTQARLVRPDLVVIDIEMPVSDGLEATRLLRGEFPRLPILILTVHDADDKLFEAVRAGANGYLLKSTSSSAFLAAVRGALAGEGAIPPPLAQRLMDEFARLPRREAIEPAADDPGLTFREAEVLERVATGATDKQIAESLSVSVTTVKSHVRSILAKLHAENRRHAARLAAAQGLLRKNDG